MSLSFTMRPWRRSWDPFSELGRLQDEADRLFNATGYGQQFLAEKGRRFPLFNVATNDKESVLTAELPGVELKDLEITLAGTSLTLKGERKDDREIPEEKYFSRERGIREFGRTVELPHKVEADQVQASLKNGVLTVRLPKSPEVQPRRIEVKS